MTATLCARVRASPRATVACLFYACTVMPGQPVGGGSFAAEKLLCMGLHPSCAPSAGDTVTLPKGCLDTRQVTVLRRWQSILVRAACPGQALLGDLPR